MADIRCSHCGKNNPDFLDVCQFCQSPLKSESMLHIGQKPTKKDTGELEGVLPDWLKNARQQARDSAEEEAAYVASHPKPKKDEPVDLLAGLFQSESSDDEDVPDWLTSINQNIKGKPAAPPAAQPEAETDFFAQFNKGDVGSKSEPPRESFSTSQSDPIQPSQDLGGRDDLSEWFSQASEQPADSFTLDREPSQPHSDWGMGEQLPLRTEESSAPKEEEDLTWLHNLENTARKTDELRSPKPTPNWEQDFGTPSQSSDQDDLSWLNNLGALPGTEQRPAQPLKPSQPQEDLSWLDSLGGTPSATTSDAAQEDLDWLNQLGGTPLQQPPPQPVKPQEDLSWLDSFKQTEEPSQPASAPQASSEDLSWLNNLGDTGAEPTSGEPNKSAEDLSWLNAFSAPPVSEPPAPAQPVSQQDLNWLDNLGGTPIEPAPSQPDKPQEDLGWLNAFGGINESQPAASAPSSTSGDLDWLNTLGSTPAQEPSPSQSSAQDDLSWLNNLQGGEADTLSSAPFAQPVDDENVTDIPHVSPFMPRKTAPLDASAEDAIPDWLKSATEGPSMPMGASELDQFREDYKVPTGPEEAFSWKSFTQDAKPAEEQPPLTSFFPGQEQPEADSAESSPFLTGSSSSIPSTEDVNSLFSMEMPDWLSQAEPTKQEDTAQPIGVHEEGGQALAPVDLPSWVQAMRPVEAVISEAAPSIDDQPTEREGPLAGFKGLIPVMPVGSARRPKPISLKLQASDEQQESAAILEQILAGETSARPLTTTPLYAPQRTLRWALTALITILLGVMIVSRPEIFPASAALTPASTEIVNRLQGLPASADVLVVMDYEAARAGEMEAVSAPLLDQLAALRHPRLSFVSTSPNGPALVERLMSNPTVKRTSDGLGGYIAGQDYHNLGFLPGAESGVLTFIQSPKSALPSALVDVFSGYSAVIVLTDNADSARVWIEQLQAVRQRDAALALQPLLVASSAQAGPMLQPYVESRQVNGLIAGLVDASRFESQNASRPGIALSYLDAFGAGMLLAVTLIVLGSLWSIITGIRARRAEVAEG